MMLRKLPVERLFSAVAMAVANRTSQRERLTVVVPDIVMRERLLHALAKEIPVVIGVEVVTLHALLDRLVPEPDSISSERLQLRLKKYLQTLPETHPLATLKRHRGGAQALLAALEEIIEAGVTAAPKRSSYAHRELAEALLDALPVIKGAARRTVQYRAAAVRLRDSPPRGIDPRFRESHLFAGFYDFAPSQIEWLAALTQFHQQHSAPNAFIDFLHPVAANEYGDYPARLLPLLKQWCDEDSRDETIGRVETRLGGSGDADSEAVIAPDEAGEVDALLRRAVEIAAKDSVPFHEMAFALTANEPYEELLREAADTFEVPLRFGEGVPVRRCGVGRRFTTLLRWWEDEENSDRMLTALRACGVETDSAELCPAIERAITSSSVPLPTRLATLARSKSLTESERKLIARWADWRALRNARERVAALPEWLGMFPTDCECTQRELSARRLLCEALLEAGDWFDEEPQLTFSEWCAMFRRRFNELRILEAAREDGITVGRIHALRGAAFAVTLIPGGGATIPGGGETPLLPAALRQAWNEEAGCLLFATPESREEEIRWLFAMAVAQGERTVVSAPRYSLLNGREQPKTASFDDFMRSSSTDLSGKPPTFPLTRLMLAERVALSQSDAIVSRLIHNGTYPVTLPAEVCAPPPIKLEAWGNIPPDDMLVAAVQELHTVQAWEDLLVCPLRGFFRHLLPLAWIDRADHIPRDRGNVVHRVLERWRGNVANSETANWDSDIADMMSACGVPDATHDPVGWALLLREVRTCLENWLRLQTEESRAAIETKTEHLFAQPDNTPLDIPLNGYQLRFRGRADLLEWCNDEGGARTLRIVDYKTSEIPPSKYRAYATSHLLQGPLYALAARQMGMGETAEVRWLYLKGAKPDYFKLSGEQLRTAVQRAAALLAGILEHASEGAFPPTPERWPGASAKTACEHCIALPVCGKRVKELMQIHSSRRQRDSRQLPGLQLRREVRGERSGEEGSDAS